jgi:hypothetical protein
LATGDEDTLKIFGKCRKQFVAAVGALIESGCLKNPPLPFSVQLFRETFGILTGNSSLISGIKTRDA